MTWQNYVLLEMTWKRPHRELDRVASLEPHRAAPHRRSRKYSCASANRRQNNLFFFSPLATASRLHARSKGFTRECEVGGDTSLPSSTAPALQSVLASSSSCISNRRVFRRDEGQGERVSTSHRCVSCQVSRVSTTPTRPETSTLAYLGNYHVTRHLGVEKVLVSATWDSFVKELTAVSQRQFGQANGFLRSSAFSKNLTGLARTCELAHGRRLFLKKTVEVIISLGGGCLDCWRSCVATLFPSKVSKLPVKVVGSAPFSVSLCPFRSTVIKRTKFE